jgi:hypothetical protein
VITDTGQLQAISDEVGQIRSELGEIRAGMGRLADIMAGYLGAFPSARHQLPAAAVGAGRARSRGARHAAPKLTVVEGGRR